MKEDNPHLNFDTAIMPQRENGALRVTHGTLYAVAPLRSSRNVGAATTAAMALVQPTQMASFSKEVGLPPARRDLLGTRANDPDEAVAYRSAILARSWLDPSPEETDRLFTKIIESVVSGLARENDAVKQLAAQLGDILPLPMNKLSLIWLSMLRIKSSFSMPLLAHAQGSREASCCVTRALLQTYKYCTGFLLRL